MRIAEYEDARDRCRGLILAAQRHPDPQWQAELHRKACTPSGELEAAEMLLIRTPARTREGLLAKLSAAITDMEEGGSRVARAVLCRLWAPSGGTHDRVILVADAQHGRNDASSAMILNTSEAECWRLGQEIAQRFEAGMADKRIIVECVRTDPRNR